MICQTTREVTTNDGAVYTVCTEHNQNISIARNGGVFAGSGDCFTCVEEFIDNLQEALTLSDAPPNISRLVFAAEHVVEAAQYMLAQYRKLDKDVSDGEYDFSHRAHEQGYDEGFREGRQSAQYDG